MSLIKFDEIFLPHSLDYNPDMEKVTFEKPDYGTKEYFENHACTLIIETERENLYIDYYSDADVNLSMLLDRWDDCIARGSLRRETFAQIQAKALKVLSQFMENAEAEIMDLFEY